MRRLALACAASAIAVGTKLATSRAKRALPCLLTGAWIRMWACVVSRGPWALRSGTWACTCDSHERSRGGGMVVWPVKPQASISRSASLVARTTVRQVPPVANRYPARSCLAR